MTILKYSFLSLNTCIFPSKYVKISISGFCANINIYGDNIFSFVNVKLLIILIIGHTNILAYSGFIYVFVVNALKLSSIILFNNSAKLLFALYGAVVPL